MTITDQQRILKSNSLFLRFPYKKKKLMYIFTQPLHKNKTSYIQNYLHVAYTIK